ncbi:MAG: hypothetical protein HYT03_01340 [Candidatus Harrisonbacteria bacterium]|nr:hypothetical protein [Candidatus Harrisonbacteria bacterium]
MPIKQVACAYCNQQVNKAQTYHIGGGRRACRTHEGVLQKKDQLEQSQKARIQQGIERLNRKKERGFAPLPPQTNPTKPNCWVCGVNGLRQDEFFLRLLMDREKARKIYGYVNPLDLSHPANHPIKEPCIFVVPKEKCADVIGHLPWYLRELPEMSGVVAICGLCAYKHKVDALPEIDADQLMKFSVIYETFFKPMLQKAASRELTRDN